jgi:hypothetical protein
VAFRAALNSDEWREVLDRALLVAGERSDAVTMVGG